MRGAAPSKANEKLFQPQRGVGLQCNAPRAPTLFGVAQQLLGVADVLHQAPMVR